MTTTAYSNLTAIAGSLGKQLRSTNLVLPTLQSPIDKSVRFKLNGRRIDWGSDGENYYIEVAASSHVVASIGAAEADLLLTDVPIERAGSVVVFARADGRFSPRNWLDGPAASLLAEMDVEDGESLLISRDRIAALTHPRTVEIDWHRAHVLVRIAESLPSSRTPIDRKPSTLPSDLRHLAHLLPLWAMPDDRERTEALRAAETSSLHDLVAQVLPDVEKVNRFLDANPGSETAIELSALVQAALEARQRLEASES